MDSHTVEIDRRIRARIGAPSGALLWALAVGLSASEQVGAGGELPNNLCEGQVREIVRKRFAQEVQRVEFRFRPYTSRGGYFRISEAHAYPVECPGFHYFEVHGDTYLCDGDVNDTSRAMVFYRSSGEGC